MEEDSDGGGGREARRTRRCNVFRRSVVDARLYCALPVGANSTVHRTVGRARFVFPIPQGRPAIVLEGNSASEFWGELIDQRSFFG